MLFGYLSTFILLVVILYLIKRFSFFQITNCKTKWSYLAFALKVIAGIGVWVIYTYYYTDRINADIYKYFDDASFIMEQTRGEFILRWKVILGLQNNSTVFNFLNDTSFWFSQGEVFFNDNRTMTRIHLILLHLSGGNYLFHTLFFSFLAFIGSLGIFHFFKHFSSLSTPTLFVFVFLVPSVLLWTSAPLKESYLFFSLGILCWTLSQTNTRVPSVLLLFLCIVNLLLLKVYILISLVPALIFWIISYRTTSQKKLLLQILFICITIVFLSLFFHQPLVEILGAKQQQFIDLLHRSGASSGISIGSFNTIGEFFLAIPHALYNVYIRPLFPPNWNPFSLLAALEHLGLLIVPIVSLFAFTKKTSIKSLRLFLFSSIFILVTGVIIGSTTPILGAIVRYKAPIIPFYLVVVFTFVDDKKLMNRWK